MATIKVPISTESNLKIINKNLFTGDCGDHVVLMNTADVALPGDEWVKRVYFHHTGYAGGATWTLAHELHEKDKTMVTNKNLNEKFTGTIFEYSIPICIFNRSCGKQFTIR